MEPVSALTLLSQQQQGATNNTSTKSTQESSSPRKTTATALLQHPQWRLLPGTLTEIAGPAGAGKTQMALTLCADSVMLQQKAVYVLLGGGSNAVGQISRRLETMLLARTNLLEQVLEMRMKRKSRRGLTVADDDNENENDSTPSSSTSTTGSSSVTLQQIHQWLQNIYLHWIRNTEDLMEFLKSSLPKLLLASSPPSMRLVVLDGIADLFRHADHHNHHDLGGGSTTTKMPGREHYQERSAAFFQISKLCKQLSEEFQVPFVVLNQATTRIDDTTSPTTTTTTTTSTSSRAAGTNHHHQQQHTAGNEDRLEPALGLSWKQCVNASFFVTATQVTYQPSHQSSSSTTTRSTTTSSITNKSTGQQDLVRRRTLKCLKSPHVPGNATLPFYIDHRGTVRICE